MYRGPPSAPLQPEHEKYPEQLTFQQPQPYPSQPAPLPDSRSSSHQKLVAGKHISAMSQYQPAGYGYDVEKPKDNLIIAVLSLVCNPILGVPAVLLAMRSRQASAAADEDTAYQSGLLALALAVAAFLSGFILYFFLILYATIFQAVIYNPWEHEFGQ